MPQPRPASEYLDSILGQEFKCLDHGFVRVIDYMGDESAIVQAARVSNGTGTRAVNEDSTLIRYLMRHQHWTPYEMCEIKYHMKLPIFVARQLIRHRTACLTGDNISHFSQPGDGRIHPVPIRKFYKMWHRQLTQKSRGKHKPTYAENIIADRIYTVPELAGIIDRREESIRTMVRGGYITAEKIPPDDPRKPSIFIKGEDYLEWANTTPRYRVQDMSDRLQRMQLRMLDEETGEVDVTSITDIWKSGKKKVYRLTTITGQKITMSANHLCYTDQGWLRLKDFVDLRTGAASARICVTMPGGKNPFQYNSSPIDIDLASEKWKWIPGLRGDYKVSNFGRVKSYKWQRKTIKQPTLTPNAYHVVSLQYPDGSQKVKLIHDLVAQTWLPAPRLNRFEIRHINGNRQDNRPDNLAYGSRQENSDDMIAHNNSTKLRQKFVDIIDLEYIGKKQTYDLSVAGPYHNFVANGVVVHNSVNEYSARYSILDKEFYIPAAEDILPQATNNKQGRAGELTAEQAENVRRLLFIEAERDYSHYQVLLKDHGNDGRALELNEPGRELILDENFTGIARELARMGLGLNYYTQWYWKTDLRNLLGFLALRADAHAQKEIRVYADIMSQMVANWVPNVFKAFNDYHPYRNAVLVSGPAWEAMQIVLQDNPQYILQQLTNNPHINKRERDELIAQINRKGLPYTD